MKLNLEQKYFEKYAVLMSKMFDMLDHILEEPDRYNNFALDNSFEFLEYDFDQKRCLKLWLKLKSMNPLHKNVIRFLYYFIFHILDHTIESYSY